MRVLIIGGGIGGLAAAVALRRLGLESLVVERAETIREIGAGLSLWSNAVKALREIGVESSVINAASIVERNSLLGPTGSIHSVSELTEIARDAGAPSICVHRATLQQILLDQLPPDVVRTGMRCGSFRDSVAVFENGDVIEADVLVGADGISSVIRSELHGTKSPRYSGCTCWRGILQKPGLLPERSGILSAAGGKQFGALPCGEGQFYWFLTHNAPRGTSVSKQEIVALCRSWAPQIVEIIEATPEASIIQNDILDRPPLQNWVVAASLCWETPRTPPLQTWVKAPVWP